MYGSQWEEIGEATSTKTSTSDDSGPASEKTKTMLTVYAFNGPTPFYFALPDQKTMSSAAVNPVVTQIFG